MTSDGPTLHMPFLRFDPGSGTEVAIEIVDQSAHADTLLRIEEAMACLVTPPNGGRGALRVAVVGTPPIHRTIFLGCEPSSEGSLADALNLVASRPFGLHDIVFFLEGRGLGYGEPGDEAALHAGISCVAKLIAVMAPPRARDTLYLAACAAVLLSIRITPEMHRRMADDILRMWVRDMLEVGDPPEWDDEATERVRGLDPWAAAFMQGLAAAVGSFRPLTLPAPLWAISAAARDLQARATLGAAEPAGSA